jgi:hypothetical protein
MKLPQQNVPFQEDRVQLVMTEGDRNHKVSSSVPNTQPRTGVTPQGCCLSLPIIGCVAESPIC